MNFSHAIWLSGLVFNKDSWSTLKFIQYRVRTTIRDLDPFHQLFFFFFFFFFFLRKKGATAASL
jgi:hypothetical protein